MLIGKRLAANENKLHSVMVCCTKLHMLNTEKNKHVLLRNKIKKKKHEIFNIQL